MPKPNVFQTLLDAVWRVWDANADFADLFPAGRRRDYGSLTDQPLHVNAADCPLMAARVAEFDLSRWATNRSIEIPIQIDVQAWFATERQADVLEGACVVLTPLLDELNNRLDLDALSLVDFSIGRVALTPYAQVSEDTMTLQGVLWGVQFPATFKVRRNPRSHGLWTD